MEKRFRRRDEDFCFSKDGVLDETLLGQDGPHGFLFGRPDVRPSLLAQHLVAEQEASKNWLPDF